MPESNRALAELLARLETDRGEDAALPFLAVAAEYFRASGQDGRPVSTHRTPEELSARLAPPGVEGRPLADVAAQLAAIVGESIWLSHPRYMGHQVSAPNPAAVWSEPVIAALNQSLAIQEMSPAATAVEHMLVQWLTEQVGLPDGAGGTFTSGGTEANFTALLAARAHALPNAWSDGMDGSDVPVVLCGQHVHYAVTRAAAQLGLGTRRALAVPVTPEFRMDIAALEQRIDQLARAGTRIMAVVATAGSTPTGAYDDLERMADVCDAHGLWLHVDGAHGMTAALSPTRAHLVRGAGRARTLAWDPHKTMLMPLSLGVVLARDEQDLAAAFTQDAPYIFHPATGRNWDQGPRTFLCSRRADPLKLWVALERYGTRAVGLLFDHLCDLTRELHARVVAHPRFEALHAPDCNILCFRYRPAAGGDGVHVDELNRQLRVDYNTRGTGWITTTMLGGKRVLRVTMMNVRTSVGDLDATLDELAERGAALERQLTRTSG